MTGTERTQSLSEFQDTAADTIDRLNRTGEAEALTVDGTPKAVLLSPGIYDEIARDHRLAQAVQMIRRASRETDQAKGLDARPAFDQLRAELLAMDAAPRTHAAAK